MPIATRETQDTATRAGRALEKYLKRVGITQSEFGRMANIPKSSVSQWVRGANMSSGALVEVTRFISNHSGKLEVEVFLSEVLGTPVALRPGIHQLDSGSSLAASSSHREDEYRNALRNLP